MLELSIKQLEDVVNVIKSRFEDDSANFRPTYDHKGFYIHTGKLLTVYASKNLIKINIATDTGGDDCGRVRPKFLDFKERKIFDALVKELNKIDVYVTARVKEAEIDELLHKAFPEFTERCLFDGENDEKASQGNKGLD